MIKRVIEVSHGSYLHLEHRQLVVKQQGKEVARIPAEDVGLLLLAHPANVITQQALAICETYGVAIAVCDERHLPSSLMLPLGGHSLHAEVLRQQVNAKPSITGRLWQKIITAKIHAQGLMLAKTGQEAGFLLHLAGRVVRADQTNLEAQAAAYYWHRLFQTNFSRNPGADGRNLLLDYGYAILRAAVARAIVGSGLHPAWGIFHHNRSDNFALADDLMEPLRPAVDDLVWQISLSEAESEVLNPTRKKHLLSLLSSNVVLSSTPLPLWVALQRYVASFKQVLVGEATVLEIPEWSFSEVIAPCG